MSCTLSVSRLGSVLNFFVSPALADEDVLGIPGATWFAFGLCAMTIIFAFLFIYTD